MSTLSEALGKMELLAHQAESAAKYGTFEHQADCADELVRMFTHTRIKSLCEVALAARNILEVIKSTEAVYDSDKRHGGRGISDEVKMAAATDAVVAEKALDKALKRLEGVMK